VRSLLKIKGLKDVEVFSLEVMYMLRRDASSASKKVRITYQTVRCHNIQQYGSHKYGGSYKINGKKPAQKTSLIKVEVIN
jgi:hypothetical protein